jgi:hypothetical protein
VQSRKTNISPQDIWEVVEIDEYLERSKLGHTKGYELLSSGKVKSVLIDGKRLVFIQSWYDYLERLLEEQSPFRPGAAPGALAATIRRRAGRGRDAASKTPRSTAEIPVRLAATGRCLS